MGPNSGLFKCNPPDYIEKEDLVKRDLFARLFCGQLFLPCDSLPLLRKLLDDRSFFINTPLLHELPPLASVGGQVITSHLQGAPFDFGSQRPSCAPS